jgi:hypothetical protein
MPRSSALTISEIMKTIVMQDGSLCKSFHAFGDSYLIFRRDG